MKIVVNERPLKKRSKKEVHIISRDKERSEDV